MSDNVKQELDTLVLLAYVLYRNQYGKSEWTKAALRNYRKLLIEVCQKRGGQVAKSMLAIIPHTPLKDILGMCKAAEVAFEAFKKEDVQS